MLYIDHKYVSLLSNRLQRFKRLNPKTYTFRCPICGDSKHNSYKTRGYIYEKKDKMLFFCHNCGASMAFHNFLKQQDDSLYQEYTQEKYINKVEQKRVSDEPDITKFQKPKFITDSPLKGLKKISQLPDTHPAKRYVVKRKIPARTHHKLFYVDRFNAWVNKFIPGKLNAENGDEPRLILPLIDKERNCFGVQGRSFKPGGVRYITIIFDESHPKVFGYDGIDTTKRVYVTEGPIDSLFVENAVAMAGADVAFDLLPDDSVFIYDNEPRNEQIVKRMEKIIDKGYNIVLWPSTIEQKDINDMVMAGHTIEEIKRVIDDHTYNGLSAKMTLYQWKKV